MTDDLFITYLIPKSVNRHPRNFLTGIKDSSTRNTKSIMPLPSWSLYYLGQHRPQHLITRLWSWFGINGSVLSWFKSYLSSRSFRVKRQNNLSSFHTSSCGVLQGSVLVPLLFIMHTTPLNTVISTLSIDHHFYADDTQLFFSFHPLNFDSSISHLQNALQQVCYWRLLIFSLLTSSRLNSCSSDSKTNLPKYTTLH